jgi:hypothetical protein
VNQGILVDHSDSFYLFLAPGLDPTASPDFQIAPPISLTLHSSRQPSPKDPQGNLEVL